jgi:hypothetical protein
VTIFEAIQSSETFATTLLVAFVDEFGLEGFQWDPQTIADEVSRGASINQDAFDRLMCGILIKTTDLFQNDLPTFINLCNSLSGGHLDYTIFDPADAAECAWSVTEHYLLDPPDDNDKYEFNLDIRTYIAKVLEYEGILNPPPILITAAGDQYKKPSLDLEYDPDLYESAFRIQKERTEDMNIWLKDRFTRLRDQLSGLVIRNGDAKKIVAGMTKMVIEG